jgi:hypothetical protein
MNNYETNLKFSELIKEVTNLKSLLEKISSRINPDEVLWDNSDMIRNWHVSERTLAEWRRKKLISVVKVNGKIWYTSRARKTFVRSNSISTSNNLFNKEERRVKS